MNFFSIPRNKNFPQNVYLTLWHVFRDVGSKKVENCLYAWIHYLFSHWISDMIEIGRKQGWGSLLHNCTVVDLWGRRSRDLQNCSRTKVIYLVLWRWPTSHSCCRLNKGYPKAFLSHLELFMFFSISGFIAGP